MIRGSTSSRILHVEPLIYLCAKFIAFLCKLNYNGIVNRLYETS